MQEDQRRRNDKQQNNIPYQGLTEEKRVALTSLEAHPTKLDKQSSKPCLDFTGTGTALQKWLLVALRNTYPRIRHM